MAITNLTLNIYLSTDQNNNNINLLKAIINIKRAYGYIYFNKIVDTLLEVFIAK